VRLKQPYVPTLIPVKFFRKLKFLREVMTILLNLTFEKSAFPWIWTHSRYMPVHWYTRNYAIKYVLNTTNTFFMNFILVVLPFMSLVEANEYFFHNFGGPQGHKIAYTTGSSFLYPETAENKHFASKTMLQSL